MDQIGCKDVSVREPKDTLQLATHRGRTLILQTRALMYRDHFRYTS